MPSKLVHQVDMTGSGLFDARVIVEEQDGTLGLQSTQRLGTTVTVRLPLRAAPEGRAV